MINRCFRFQTPDAYGGEAVSEPIVPTELRYGRTEDVATGPAISEEPMGAPDAVRLDVTTTGTTTGA